MRYNRGNLSWMLVVSFVIVAGLILWDGREIIFKKIDNSNNGNFSNFFNIFKKTKESEIYVSEKTYLDTAWDRQKQITNITENNKIRGFELKGIVCSKFYECGGFGYCTKIGIQDCDRVIEVGIGNEDRVISCQIKNSIEYTSKTVQDLSSDFAIEDRVILHFDVIDTMKFDCGENKPCINLSNLYKSNIEVNKFFWENFDKNIPSKVIGPVLHISIYE